MDQLTITDLTADQFASLAESTSHRIALNYPTKWLCDKEEDTSYSHLVISTRYIDKENPSARLPFATRIPIEEGIIQRVNLLWSQDTKSCLLETHIAGCIKYQHLELPARSKYKMVSLTVRLDKL